jgi:hypothetical protein
MDEKEPPPYRPDEALDPVGDIRAGRSPALVSRALALTPDNAHRCPLMERGVEAPMADPQAGSAAQGPAYRCPQ